MFIGKITGKIIHALQAEDYFIKLGFESKTANYFPLHLLTNQELWKAITSN